MENRTHESNKNEMPELEVLKKQVGDFVAVVQSLAKRMDELENRLENMEIAISEIAAKNERAEKQADPREIFHFEPT